ncbi:hypothetical protein HOY82DRAFT_641144 [Tuber indicum]|nr:hypothetical protein HOY82DRAFT_641144 [Tuber indicum]
MSFEDSLLETFNNILEHGDFGSPDIEFHPLFDQEPGSAAPCNQGINFTCPLGEYCREGEAGLVGSESREPSTTDPPEKNVVATVENKKRKSSGKQLPIPTTNLPPRKRAKTEEEKEQRRIERILRNRAAARSSRERKERHVQDLEEERRVLAESNTAMNIRLSVLEESNRSLRQQLLAMEQTIEQYAEHIAVLACDVTTNSTPQRADPHSSTTFWGVPEQSVSEEESLFGFLDALGNPHVTTIDPSVLGGPIGPC